MQKTPPLGNFHMKHWIMSGYNNYNLNTMESHKEQNLGSQVDPREYFPSL